MAIPLACATSLPDLHWQDQAQLVSMVEKAMEMVQVAMESEDKKTRVKAAMYVLKMVGLHGYGERNEKKHHGDADRSATGGSNKYTKIFGAFMNKDSFL